MNTESIIYILISCALAYLLGSVNFAIIVSRVMGGDVREHGSGNAGMTNILRTYGKLPAVLTALGDLAKALAAVVLARVLIAQAIPDPVFDIGYLAGIFVMLGHVYPIFFKFRGGKGVMTSLGVILVVDPVAFIIIAVIFIPLIFITRIVSIGSVLGAASFPIITLVVRLIQGRNPLYDTLLACVYTVIILVMHRDNIKRLLSGTENKFGSNKKPPEEKQ